MSVHLTTAGAWAACEGCELLIHADLELAATAQLPEAHLWLLANAAQPPTFINPAGQLWWQDDALRMHRAYGLPAFVHECENPRDTLHEWWVEGHLHREHDLPARVRGNGAREWYVNGRKHRDLGLPAVVHPDGSCEYWYLGEEMGARTARSLRERFLKVG